MKAVTSVTLWNDAVGKRISVTYSEIDETTGKVTKDNLRVDRVVTDEEAKKTMDSILSYAQNFVDAG
jgi:hypothetical protein